MDFFVEFIIYNNINLNNYNEKEWKLMIAIGLLIMLVLNIIYAAYNLKKRMDVWNTIAVFCMVAFSIVLLFRLGTIPTVFIDEGNGMYDSWSLAKYGVDSNLISNPIY